jgi:hypothetical protein
LVLVGVWLVAGGAGAGGLVRARGGLLRGGASGGGYQAEAVRAGAGEIEREVGLWRLRLGVEWGPGPATWSEAAGSKLDVRGGRVSQGVGAGGCGRARELRAASDCCELLVRERGRGLGGCGRARELVGAALICTGGSRAGRL